MTKVKLNRLSDRKLAEMQMNSVQGGREPGNCCCGCLYQNNGGSTTADNAHANNQYGYYSPIVCDKNGNLSF